MKKLILMLALVLSSASAASATISNLSLVVNTTYNGNATDRGIMNTNATLNFSFSDSLASKYTNITFPNTFNFSGVLGADILNNTGSASLTVSKNSTVINITYTGVAAQRFYFNITKNITLPAASGTYAITVFTNGSTTPVSVNLYARNSSRPYFVTTNSSVHTVSSETFGDNTTTITLSGKGVSNLTILAPNSTSQGKVLVGWGATNASLVFANRSNSQTTLYIEVDSTVQDPVIVVSLANELEQANLPAAIVAIGATIATLYVVYRSRRRTR